ncbi:MAG: sigma-54-dependent Fis family transcriptional regulator [Magnetococcales bacterium]|nr:sigma-54-dependent Fis family transcriptional regulator [Magnetococcales bacterium]
MKKLEPQLLGESPEFLAVLRTVGLLAPTDVTVLITGESGTGKELIAHHIAANSRRAQGPRVSINCAALPETLAESELFGHGKGAFTGAIERRPGRVQSASGGTLFLDEISELPLSIQPKLLRLLENGECQVVGQPHVSRADVRIVAATNKDLSEMVRQGTFRADLFFRLNIVPLELPPLRQRQGDIPLLLEAFLQNFSKQHNTPSPVISRPALQILQSYLWPGNIRELRNWCERTCILHRGETIESHHLPKEILAKESWNDERGNVLLHLPEKGINLANLEQNLIQQALQRSSGNKSRAARLLGLTRDTFLYRLKKVAVSL